MSKKTDTYGEDWDLIASKVKAEKNYTCEECGATRNLKTKLRITVHHRDGNPKNNERTNLQCLCNKCHLQKQKFLQAGYLFRQQESAGQTSLIPK
jgi:5-methylcytosine-specific restriction endonuclease McrA